MGGLGGWLSGEFVVSPQVMILVVGSSLSNGALSSVQNLLEIERDKLINKSFKKNSVW